MLPIHRIVLVSVFLPGLTAAHSPLLPKPQQIHYGSGQLPLKSLSIRLAPDAADEDRFAAAELSRILSARCQTSVPIADAATPSILLKRTGPVAALPVPDEKPGPDSRESYQLKITSAGGEVDATSSAGLYYAIQTLRQLVEGDGPSAAIPEVEIRDWPSLAYRGTMIDLSHGPLPTVDEIERQLDFLARWKANQYYFYTEAAIELDGNRTGNWDVLQIGSSEQR